MADFIPVNLKVRNKKIIMIGGGQVAYRHTKRFLAASANVTIVSAQMIEPFFGLEAEGRLTLQIREVLASEQFEADLLCLATDDERLNHSLYENNQHLPFIYLANNLEQSDLHFMCKLEQGPFVFAWSTNGASPAYAKSLSEKFKKQLPLEEIETDLHFLGKARALIKGFQLPTHIKKKLLQEIAEESFLKDSNREGNLLQKLVDSQTHE
ncbi:bifunctional precorrin-2 dehydrogenase/sirohydrochlorin ferrochelatase [Alkalihalobacillus sp. 1P02AB]|uniref:precorrin-2 dehydrogenase/sirohydrochlorin ferrochelatase family protein n=1 Tax=Alkalihalobacillus sp. 1P02AB TaxID=3132260 RepID=UPI0039A78046